MTRHIEEVMGTVVSIEVPDHTDPKLLGRVFAWMHMVEQLFSVFIPDSEISRIGRGELLADDADPAVRHVLTKCDELQVLTEGAFRHRHRTVDRPLDPSGYVKGWSVERALLDLRIAGVPRACIGAGGDTAGFVSDGEQPWKVGIRNPDDPDGVAAILDLTNGAVATSAEYERGHHIQGRPGQERPGPGQPGQEPPRPGQPDAAPPAGILSPLTSVSVIGPDLGICDALATAIWADGAALGISAPPWMSNFPGHDTFVCTTDGRIVYSERLQPIITAG